MADLNSGKSWIGRLLSTPIDQLSRGQYRLRFSLELCVQGFRRLRENRASQMAAALAFRTIFGLVPVIVIAILIFRAFGGAEIFGNLVEQILEAANLENVRSPDETLTLAEWCRQFVSSIDSQISGKAVGVIGALVLSWAAISLITTIERSFNTICQTSEHRPLGRRIPLYWTMVTIGPILLYLSFHFRTQFMRIVSETSLVTPFARTIAIITSFLSVWLLLVTLYVLVPHARMRLRATALGALIAAILWTGATNLFGWYIAWSFSKENSAFTILYSSLGLVPLFLMWIYFLWLVVLYGLEIAHTTQMVGKRLGAGLSFRTEPPVVIDPATIVVLMKAASVAFVKGEPVHSDDLVEVVNAPPATIDAMLEALAKHGFLHRIDREDEPHYSVARPPSAISTNELLDVALSLSAKTPDPDSASAQWVEEYRAALRNLDVHRSIAEL
ncbi:MAG TPA: YihY/virulence factor BrkB family protein [Phycisphaerae bacterium]|nr:YihY/virulence factor BrkB family protein [Phycisphaerae bacterium]HRW51846.1 YihY/virulence factor BrkB family protein [Phycisphaerae bacterium]